MIKIQKATKEDIRGIQDVFYKAWLETYPNEEVGITREDVEERFKDRFSDEKIQSRMAQIEDVSGNNLFLIAKDRGMVVGVCKLEKEDIYNKLGAIYVLPECQRKGIGMMFWETAKEYFADERDIIVQVATYNMQAISFYQKLGFVDTGKRFTEEFLKMPISGVFVPEMQMIISLENKKTR